MAAHSAASSQVGHFTGLGISNSNTSPDSLIHVSQAQNSPRQSSPRSSTSSKSGTRRFGFRAGARKALFAVKKGLRTAFRRAVCCGSSAAPGAKVPVARQASSSKRSVSIRSRLSARSRRSVRAAVAARAGAGTPTICVTRPTLNGKNVRLSLHKGPAPQTVDGEDSKKSTRFSHPVVDAMVPQTDLTPMASPAAPSFVSASSGESWATVSSDGASALEDGRADDANKVFASVRLSDVQSCYNARAYLDGLKGRSVSCPAPALPYVAYSPQVSVEDFSTESGRALYAQKVADDLAASGKVEADAPVVCVFPSALVPGQQGSGTPAPSTGLKSQSLNSPRTTAARPHTTGELSSVPPGTSFLPYIAYNPSFNPYNSSKASTPSKGKAPAASQSDSSLGAANAEVEACEQATHNARHSAHYARVESGVFHSPVVVSFAESAAPTNQIRRKPVPSPTSKPLPATPIAAAAASVPASISMVDNGFPVLDAASARAYVAVPNYSRRSINVVEAQHKKEEAARAAKKAKKAAQAVREKKAAGARRAAAVEAGVAKLML